MTVGSGYESEYDQGKPFKGHIITALVIVYVLVLIGLKYLVG